MSVRYKSNHLLMEKEIEASEFTSKAEFGSNN